MAEIKFIYFDGCPNADKTRSALKQLGIAFEEIRQDDLSENDPHKAYSSTTILKGKEIIFGCKTGEGGGCSLQIPSAQELRHKLIPKKSTGRKTGVLSAFGSLGSALTVGLCPVCIPAIGAFLSSIGLGFLISESVLLPLLLLFLIITIGGLLWSYLKEHRNIWPLITGVAMGLALYLGRYVYFGAGINQVLMYGGIAGMILVSLWNLRLRKSAACSACVSDSKN